MLRELEIETYRGLKEIVLSDLGRMNIVIGENNSGKTSILEAIQLFDTSDVLSNAIAVARKREAQVAMFGRNRLQAFDMLLYSFPLNAGREKELYVSAYSDEWGACRAGIRGELEKQLFFLEDASKEELKQYEMYSDEEGYIRTLTGEYIYEKETGNLGRFYFNEGQRAPKIIGAYEEENRYSSVRRNTSKIMYISPMDIYTNKVISASLYKGMLVEEKRKLLELLRLFDERIVGIETGIQYGRGVTFIEMEDCGLVPLSIFGDGLKKVLTLASAVVKMRGGIVLIDEFETGIHKQALVQVAKWLAAVTERYDVQVFLTTHSGYAIDALINAQECFEDINAYRLEHYKSNIYVKKFNGEDLYKLRKNQGMDIL